MTQLIVTAFYPISAQVSFDNVTENEKKFRVMFKNRFGVEPSDKLSKNNQMKSHKNQLN